MNGVGMGLAQEPRPATTIGSGVNQVRGIRERLVALVGNLEAILEQIDGANPRNKSDQGRPAEVRPIMGLVDDLDSEARTCHELLNRVESLGAKISTRIV